MGVNRICSFRDLQKALVIYGSGSGGRVKPGDSPVQDKSALVEKFKQVLVETTAFCKDHGINLDAIQKAEGFDKVKLLDDAVDAILVKEESKKQYLLLANNVANLYKAILPDPAANALAQDCILIEIIAQKIRSLSPETDISEVMGKVEKLLDGSIATEGYVIRDPRKPSWGDDHIVDLSQIDFEALKAKFERSRKHIETEKLKSSISGKLKKMIRLNRTRMDYMERFQQMIDEYNEGSINIDEFFNQLVDFASSLNEEEKRNISENLSEEELAIFDLLTKPDIKLTKKEKLHVKKIAKDLLEKLRREKLVLDWRKRQQSRAQVRITIEDVLDKELPETYTPELYNKKCDVIYQHIYDSYYGADKSAYYSAE